MKTKTRKKWSPEQRLAASERAKARFASKDPEAPQIASEPPKMPLIPGPAAKSVEMGEMGVLLLLEARAYKQELGNIKGDVWRSEVDHEGGLWSVGDLEDGTDADGVHYRSGIRIVYEKNHYAHQTASYRLMKVNSEFGAAERAVRVRKQHGEDPVPEWDAELERLTALKAELETIRDSKETFVWIFPDRAPIRVVVSH